jgi:hypothetical protein
MVVSLVQKQNMIWTATQEIEHKMDDKKIKYAHVDVPTLVKDLNQIIKENQNLTETLQS